MVSRRPTQADVAKRAGVSRSTVSIVLSNREDGPIPIGEETRQRVLEAAQELGYAPNLAAQMLAQGTTHMIAVFSYGDQFPMERMHKLYEYVVGIEREASRQDYNVLLITRGQSAENRSIYMGGSNALRLADGAILMGWADDYQEVCRLAAEDYPFVYIGRRDLPGCEVDWVASDYIKAGEMASQHLMGLGHRRLALVWSGPMVEENQDRLKGCHRAIKGVSDAILYRYPPELLQDTTALAERLRADGVTALMGGINSLQWATKAIHQLGKRIPQDMSIISLYYDEPHLWTSPDLELTHIQQNQIRVGELAVRTLVRRLTGEVQGRQHIRVPVELVIGNSTQ